MIAGTASGSSTRVRIWRRVSPIPRAASSTSGGALRSPATMFGKRITSVYATSAISTVVRRDAGERDEQLEEREARDRVEERRDDPDRLLERACAVREQARARTRARSRCRPRSPSARGAGRARGESVSCQCSRTQSQQKVWSPRTQELPCPKFGITGPAATSRSQQAHLRRRGERRRAPARRRRRRGRASVSLSSISETAFRSVVVGAPTTVGSSPGDVRAAAARRPASAARAAAARGPRR